MSSSEQFNYAFNCNCYHFVFQKLSNPFSFDFHIIFPLDLTLLDWGPTNHVAVALDNEVYLWNATNNSIENLLSIEGEDNYVSCVSWIQEGCVLAVGKADGTIQVSIYCDFNSFSPHSPLRSAKTLFESPVVAAHLNVYI